MAAINEIIEKILKRLNLESDPSEFYTGFMTRCVINIERDFPDSRLRIEDACLLALYETQEAFIIKLEHSK